MQITEIKALLGTVGEVRTVMGFISQLEDGIYFLEDLSGTMPIDIEDALTAAGFYLGRHVTSASLSCNEFACKLCKPDTSLASN